MNINALIPPPHVAEAARGFSIVQRVSQVALAAGVCLMLHSPEAQGQAWNASQSPVFLNREDAQVGIGTNVPQKSLHIREVQFNSTFFPGEPPFPIPTCSNGFPTIRLSPLTFDASLTQITNCPDLSDNRNNWDIEGATNKLGIRFNLQERLSLTGNGNLGIGYTTPNFPLSFGTSVANTKIALYEANGSDVYGWASGRRSSGCMWVTPRVGSHS